MKYFLTVCLLFVLLSGAGMAAIEAVQFKDAVSENRYRNLIAELRCLVCQNQNLADSDADLAKDLRRKTAEMIKAGKTDAEILQYMQTRYGDFVLYRPPFSGTNALLWLGPFVLLLIAGFVVFRMIQRREQSSLATSAGPDEEAVRIRVRNLLQDAPDQTSSNSRGTQPDQAES